MKFHFFILIEEMFSWEKQNIFRNNTVQLLLIQLTGLKHFAFSMLTFIIIFKVILINIYPAVEVMNALMHDFLKIYFPSSMNAWTDSFNKHTKIFGAKYKMTFQL